MTREMGKILKETRGDTQEAIDTAYYFAGEGRRMYGPTTPRELPNKFAMAVRTSVGVCGMISPWNFPMAIPSWKLFPPSCAATLASSSRREDTPLSTSTWCARSLTPESRGCGQHRHRTWRGGRHAADGASAGSRHFIYRIKRSRTHYRRELRATFKRCSLELGGKNPMIVLDDANLDLALEGALWGAFGTTGQRCTATSRIILQKGVYAGSWSTGAVAPNC